ncbi:3-phenylpropionate/trans-cinnamate dioxygenase ferredoxin reductase subunit [Actinacidiphila yanglinensis]|uniref:3-phenylpropionate/trans-cinnamate dioxygenase ferredoxin reductase subunit n=1 Tax=Actinacidiphila yanglinensis TaxID=310779 RepID=A0A1H6DW30_9ACTN|nr:FAD-dependent oxidoreductase [Actinacidiphila yanglinensis]SEG89550.1 3-phenylpropionate/trans-cinnamate dioxygenase ferredoxin reductase subunit [Actinacidiphila yanglinensis]
MGSNGTLIVGASQAGLQLAVSLRQFGDTAPITLVGAEPQPPYQRPPLSKEFLTGSADLGTLALRNAAFYRDSGIDLVCGERITSVRLADEGPPGQGCAVTARGRHLAFDRLALTVGARPRRLRLPGSALDGVCTLRDHADAADLRRRLETAAHVVVVGGGFIGLEAAAAARALGLASVTVVEAADRLMARAVAPVVSDFYRRAHERRGATVRLGAAVAAFEGDRAGRVTGVRLADGTLLPADLVLVGAGVQPRTELAEQLGLACDGGVLVDERARTSRPGVVAAGDCTVQPDPMTGRGRVRLESVQNAVAQAQAAAATLLGRERPRPQVPWFWSFQGDLKLQTAGLSGGHDGYVVRGEPADERFCVLYYRGGRLLAADAVNRPADYMAVRKALTNGATMDPALARDPAIPLKSLISADVPAASAPAAL